MIAWSAGRTYYLFLDAGSESWRDQMIRLQLTSAGYNPRKLFLYSNKSRNILHYEIWVWAFLFFNMIKTSSFIWALARAPDLHLNIHQLVTSSINSKQHTTKVPHLPDELAARALKHRYMVCYGTRLSRLSTLSTTEKRQNVTFLIGYNSRTV